MGNQPGGIPQCEVILGFRRPSDGCPASLSRACSSQPVQRLLIRLAIYFKFAKGPSVACEAVVKWNELSGLYKVFTPWSEPDIRVCLGFYEIGRGDIWKAFLCISNSSVYDAETNNSHTWVAELMRLLNISVPHNVSTIASGIAYALQQKEDHVTFPFTLSADEAASISRQRKTGCGTENEAEERSQRRDCEVRLGFSRIEGSKGLFLSSSSTARCLMHWAVDIKIIRGALYRCHAGDDNGLLKAKQELCYSTLPDQIVVGTYKISENEIQQVMEELSECGKYDKIRNNCQIWVVKFLFKLNIPFPDMLKTIGEKMPDFFVTDKYKNYRVIVELLKQHFRESARENSAEELEAAI